MRIVKATFRHASALYSNLSPSDITECIALGALKERPTDKDLFDLLADGVLHSEEAWALTLGNDLVLAIGGVRAGKVWMLTSSAMGNLTGKMRLHAAMLLKGHLKMCIKEFGALDNYVHSRNFKHIKLLRVLGASFGNTVTTDDGEEFHYFIFGEV